MFSRALATSRSWTRGLPVDRPACSVDPRGRGRPGVLALTWLIYQDLCASPGHRTLAKEMSATGVGVDIEIAKSLNEDVQWSRQDGSGAGQKREANVTTSPSAEHGGTRRRRPLV